MDDNRSMAHLAPRIGRLMRCYCGQSQPGVWDQRGIVHNGSECRFTDLLYTVHGTYRQAGSPGRTLGHSGPDTSHSRPRSTGLSSIHDGNDRSTSMRASTSSMQITVTTNP